MLRAATYLKNLNQILITIFTPSFIFNDIFDTCREGFEQFKTLRNKANRSFWDYYEIVRWFCLEIAHLMAKYFCFLIYSSRIDYEDPAQIAESIAKGLVELTKSQDFLKRIQTLPHKELIPSFSSWLVSLGFC